MSLAQKIADVESQMARTQKNKHTQGHLALLKAKLAKLKRELIDGGSSKGGGGQGFDVSKTGEARVGLVGFPSVGKSTLMTKLTGTFSEAADYQFTTLTCIPGTIFYKGSKIQLLDLPGIIQGAKDGKGRGKQVIGVARTCNLIMIVLDVTKPLIHKRLIEHQVEGFGIRLNKKPPNVVYKRKDKGGINIVKMAPCPQLEDDTIKSICKEYRVANADITIRETIDADSLIDIIEGNRMYIPAIYVLNKIDAITIQQLDLLSEVPHYVPISAKDEWNFDQLLEKIWQYLDLIRIYTKPKGQIPDYTAPVIIPRSRATIQGFCNRLHKHMVSQMKYAWVWGLSVKHNPQKVGRDHMLIDQDIVQIVKK